MARRNHLSRRHRMRRYRRVRAMAENRCLNCRRRPDAAFRWVIARGERRVLCTRCQ